MLSLSLSLSCSHSTEPLCGLWNAAFSSSPAIPYLSAGGSTLTQSPAFQFPPPP